MVMLRLFRAYCFYEKKKRKGKKVKIKKKKEERKEKTVCFTFVGTAVDCSCQGNKQ